MTSCGVRIGQVYIAKRGREYSGNTHWFGAGDMLTILEITDQFFTTREYLMRQCLVKINRKDGSESFSDMWYFPDPGLFEKEPE
jgi:hypothetical protein